MPASGSCLCGAIRFDVQGPLRPVINCHCSQCRKWTGHFVAATAAWQTDLEIHDPDKALKWYESSAEARRGFCARCGASLFWQQEGADTITILAGSLDGNTGLTTAAQIYVDDKGDYYTLSDPEAPRFAQTGHAVTMPERGGV